jgi:tRNA pseudouridine55 synthase
VPPAYSALKVDGQRAYDLARAGHEVVLASRNVTIHALRVLETAGPAMRWKAPRSKPMCPRAPISAASRDIALALGTRGHVTMLRRLKAGPFTLDQAISLDKLNEWGQGAPLRT